MEKHYQQYLLFSKCLKVVDKYATRTSKYELTKNVIKIFNDARIMREGASDVLRKDLQQRLIIKNIILPTVAKRFSKEIIDIIYSPVKLENEGKLVVKKEKDGTVFTYKDFTQKLGDCHYDSWSKHSDDKTIASILMEFSNMSSLRGGMMENYPSKMLDEVFRSIKPKAQKYYELVLPASFTVASKIDKDFQLRSTEPELEKGFGVIHPISNFKFDDNCIIVVQLFVTQPILYAVLDKILSENKNHQNITILVYHYARHSGDIKFRSPFKDISIYAQAHSSYKTITCNYITRFGILETIFAISTNPEIAKILQNYEKDNSNN